MVARCNQLACQTSIRHVTRWLARQLDIKLDMVLDGGSPQAARQLDIKLDMVLNGGSL